MVCAAVDSDPGRHELRVEFRDPLQREAHDEQGPVPERPADRANDGTSRGAARQTSV